MRPFPPKGEAMQTTKFVVDLDGEILQHATDFEAVGRNLSEVLTARTWPWAKQAIDDADAGDQVTSICEFRDVEPALSIVELRMSKGAHGVAVTARHLPQIPAALFVAVCLNGKREKRRQLADPRVEYTREYNRLGDGRRIAFLD
jgi:hypothetical protein